MIKLSPVLYKAIFICVISVATFHSSNALADEVTYTRTIQADIEDIRVDVENAISNRAFVIDFHAKVGDMLNRTAADVGSETDIYLHADSWQFCSAVLSRKMMEADPLNIAFCPYVIFAYTTTKNPSEVVVGFRLAEDANAEDSRILDEVNELLTGIVNEVTES